MEVAILRKFNNYTNLGVFFNGIWIISNRANFLPDLIEGLCMGLGLILTFIGLYSKKHYISNLRNYKINLLNKVFKKISA